MSIFFSREQDGTLNVRVSGYVTKDPKVTEKIVLFSVCYGKKKYMDCKAWTSDAAGQIAACLEHHDSVAVDGVYEEFTGRDGQPRKQLSVDGVFPMVVPSSMEAPPPAPADAPASQPYSAFQELSDSDDGLPF